MKRRRTRSLIILLVFVAFLFIYFRFVHEPSGVSNRKRAGEEKIKPLRSYETVRFFGFTSSKSLEEWKEKLLAKNKTDYSLGVFNGKGYVNALSRDSASALFYKQRLSRKRNPFVSWEWKAGKFPKWREKESLREKEEFDFVAQVYVIFMSSGFLNAKAIQYVWTERIPAGTVADSPYTGNVKILVLRSGVSEEWQKEERDIIEDYLHLFGEAPEKDVSAISFMTDSDSTDSVAEASYANIRLGYMDDRGSAEPLKANGKSGSRLRGREVEVKIKGEDQ